MNFHGAKALALGTLLLTLTFAAEAQQPPKVPADRICVKNWRAQHSRASNRVISASTPRSRLH